MKAIIVSNEYKDERLNHAKKIKKILEDNNIQTYIAQNYKDQFDNYRYKCDRVRNVDYIISIGGDGTLLQAVHDFGYMKTAKFIGVNLGTLGFMTDFKIDNIEEELLKVINDDCYTFEYNTLSVDVKEKNFHDKCLNDVVIGRNGFARIIDIQVIVNNTELYTFSGDGILISTAMGSTAYNLSLGGPIVHPLSNTITITPIAPHSVKVKPIIIPKEFKVQVKILGGHKKTDKEAIVTCDGRNNDIFLSHNDIVTINSPDKVKIVKLKNSNYFKNLKEKLN